MSHDPSQMSPHAPLPQAETSHERVMLKTGPLWASALGLVTLIVVSMGLMRAFQLALSHDKTEISPSEAEHQVSLLKRMAPLDPDQRAQRIRYEAEQNKMLSHYSWVDQKQQLARIPIQRAMSLIVKKYGKAE